MTAPSNFRLPLPNLKILQCVWKESTDNKPENNIDMEPISKLKSVLSSRLILGITCPMMAFKKKYIFQTLI